MANNPLFELKTELIELCREVALFIRAEMEKVGSSDIEIKDKNSFVTYVDKEAERQIVEKLRALTPEAGFITEENTIEIIENEQMWVIDPLDGTTNFLHKIPHFSISIAFMRNHEVLFGIVYDVMSDVAYTAIKGFGAWENNKPISVSKTKELSQAIVVTGFPYKRDIDIDSILNVLKYYIVNARGIRRLGSAALDLAYVASGKIDIYYEGSLNIWDLAAGALLVSESGGMVSDFKGEDNFLKTGSIIVSNGHLHENIQQVIKTYLP